MFCNFSILFSYNCIENELVLIKTYTIMKYNTDTYSDVEVLSTTKDKDITLSPEATSTIFRLLSKTIYSNPIGSIVREITSNCFDSHVEAGVNVPVLIKKIVDKMTGGITISFIDYGVGMSPERIDKIFSVLLKSTKCGDNEQIGCFGLGSKSPLSYKRSTGFGEGEYDNSYEVITIFNGGKYTYQIYDGKKCPKITEPTIEITTEHNGTEVRIPVLARDVYTFEKEMIRQLYYFENVIFEGFENEYDVCTSGLSNDYQIIRGKTFLHRGTEYNSNMHICLGRVAYPIDYDVLGLDSRDYRLPIAVKIEIGEIGVTASREQIDYSENTIKILKKKLTGAKAEIVEMLSKQYSNITTLAQYFEVKSDFGKLHLANDKSIYVGDLIKKTDIDFSNFKYSFMKMPNDKQLFRFFFDSKLYGKKRKSRYNNDYFEGGYTELTQKQLPLYYIGGEFVRKVMKQAYLKHEHGTFFIISKREHFQNRDIAELFNVAIDKQFDDNGKPVAFLESLLELQEEYFEIVQANASDYDTIIIPDDFIAERKKGKDKLSIDIRNSSIPVKFGSYGRSKTRIVLNNLFNFAGTIFYGEVNKDELAISNANSIYTAVFGDKMEVTGYSDYDNNFYRSGDNTNKRKNVRVMFLQVAHNNIKFMEYCKNANHVDTFYSKMLFRKEEKVKAFFQTHDLVEKWSKVEGLYPQKEFSKVSEKWSKKINEIQKFIDTLSKPNRHDIGYYKDELSKYFDLTNVKMTPEQKRIERMIGEVIKLQKDNEKLMKYIDIPWHIESAEQDFFDLLKKVMAL